MELIKITDAIKSLTDNPFTLIGMDLDNIVWDKNNLPKPTKKEILDQVEKLEKDFLIAEKTKETNRLSALAKLAALGLTEDEIAAL